MAEFPTGASDDGGVMAGLVEGPGGSCGALQQPDGSVLWRVWAPRAKRVDLVLFDGGARRSLPMEAEPFGYFHRRESGIGDGQRYAYRLDNGPERPDPCSRWQPEGVHRPSAVLDPSRLRWSGFGWKGVAREELVIYELHVGTFTPEGTFDAVISRLDALKDLGITAIELLPVAQFSGNRNWGYDGVHLYAPQNTYGGPHGLQRLIDACHVRGLAIFLDVVYNHFGPEGNYAPEFGPYGSDRYRTPWGAAFNYDGPSSDSVRQFVLENVRMWLEDYHFDGLRLDATQAIFDQGPHHILRAIQETADGVAARANRRIHLIAENLLNDVRIVLPAEAGGHGLAAEWNDDFHHALHAYLTGERQGKYVDFGDVADLPRMLELTYLLDGVYCKYRGRRWGAPAAGLPGDRFVGYIQNHDQVGNRARGERLDVLVSPAARRLAASLLLLAPQLPLIFMGEEYGEENPFLFFCSFGSHGLIESVRHGRRRDYAFAAGAEVPDPQAEATFTASKLSWSWPEGSRRAGLRRLYQDLLAARRNWPALRDMVRRRARLLSGDAVLELVRGDESRKQEFRAYFNLTGESQSLPAPGPEFVTLFCSESSRYGGGRKEHDPPFPLAPHECVVLAPRPAQ
jgi:maltooligosyltrehalose trehalohydrolase